VCLGAIGADDVGTIVSTGAEALGGRGDDLNRLLRDLTTVVVDLDSQRQEIVATIDGFAQMADDLAAGDDQVVHLVEDLSDASVTLAENRERIIGALRGIRDMTRVTNEAVLDEHTDALISTIQDLDPIMSTLATQRPLIEEMMTATNSFLVRIADNVDDGSTPAQAQYVWAKGIATPSGTLGENSEQPAPPQPSGPDPRDVQGDIQRLLDTLLGFLGTDPLARLPIPVCRALVRLGVELPVAQVCGPAPARPAPGGEPAAPLDPIDAIDRVLGGLPG
jgi:ABC-type transporter Mla subunit MlaD